MRLDREILHPIHPMHKLNMTYTEVPFRCDGCKEAGIGHKYHCSLCDFDMHRACAQAPATVTHPFYPKCEFSFLYRPPGSAARVCDACRKDVAGFVYHCHACGFDLHPCCANLPQRLDDGERDLYLCPKLSDGCGHCGRRGLGWCYRSECRSYVLHVSCVKELLVESWRATYLSVDKNKAREMQTKIPNLRGAVHTQGRAGRGTVERGCRIAATAARIVVSAVLGDPTPIIAAVVGKLLSK